MRLCRARRINYHLKGQCSCARRLSSIRASRGVRFAERLRSSGRHGVQAIAIEHLAARLAGGFLQPINSDSLKEAIGEAIAMDLGEFNDIKTLPGFPRAAAATLEKAWAAGLKFTELAKTSDALVRSRIDAVTRLEASGAEAIASVNASACGLG